MMTAFGVQFTFDDFGRFQELATLIAELKRDKDADGFRDPQLWLPPVPDAIKARFNWPTQQEREQWLGIRGSTVIMFPDADQMLGQRWDFYRVFESVEEGDYAIHGCERVREGVGEIRINPNAYPYGGLGPFIALAEAFGFKVLGVNECGRFAACKQ